MKNMQNIPDKDLDHIFKQAAEFAEVKFHPEAWQKMERKLDAHGGKMRKIIYGVGALALIGALFFQVSREQALRSSASYAQLLSARNGSLGIPPLREELMQEESLFAKGEEADQEKSAFQNGAGMVPGIAVKQANEEIQVNELIAEEAGAVRPDEVSGLTTELMKAEALAAGPLAVQMPGGEIIKAIEFRPQPAFKSHFSAGLSVSPDFSGVGLSSFSRTGTNVGVSIQYHISRRFSIVTGVIRSRKGYEVTDGFKPYEGYWNYYPKPNLIDGGCTVIDIPVNIRYRFVAKERNRVFVSAGVSSYLMNQEEYTFIYSGGVNSDYEVRNQNQHYFGIFNASAGYERMLGRNWGLQIEPFVKLPLEDIGVGNLKLLSAGAFITLNYHFLK